MSTLLKNLKWSKLGCIICRPELYNLKTRKKVKTYLIVRIGLSLKRTETNLPNDGYLLRLGGEN